MDEELNINIYEKLLAIQTELRCGKNLRNKFGGFNYRSCETILEALKPFLKKFGVIILLDDKLVNIGERYYIQAEAKLVDIATKDTISNFGYAREEREKKGMDASQITGSCSSYARKYALSGLLALDDGRDADSMAPSVVDDVDEEVLAKCHEKGLEDVKDEIRTIVEAMSEVDPNLAAYQTIMYNVLGEGYATFKVGSCTEEQKDVLDNILARLLKVKK